MDDIDWYWQSFKELDPEELYDILALRQRTFIVEQKCAYLDADGLDLDSLHLSGRNANGRLVAYLRIIPPGLRFPGPSLGRVVTAPEIRRTGVGRRLMLEGIRKAAEHFHNVPIYLSAQRYLEHFYSVLGFVPFGVPYNEDGIQHIAMIRRLE